MKNIAAILKRVSIILLVFIVAILISLYWIGTQNFYLGSNSQYFNTAFEFENSVWECKKYNLSAEWEEITDEIYVNYMNVVDSSGNTAFCISPLGKFLVEVYADKEQMTDYFSATDQTAADLSAPIDTVSVKYKKRFGKVYAFKLYPDPENNKILDYDGSMVFRLRK